MASNVVVDGIPISWTKTDIENIFKAAGSIQDIRLTKSPSGQSGTIHYRKLTEALAAVILFDRRSIFPVDKAKRCHKPLDVYVPYVVRTYYDGSMALVTDGIDQLDIEADDTESCHSDDTTNVQDDRVVETFKYNGSFFDPDRFRPVFLGDSIVSWVKALRNMDLPIASSYVFSPTNFYVQFEHSKDQLRNLNERLREFCETTRPVQYSYKKTEICVVRFENKWNRAVVLDQTMASSEKLYDVRFLDIGSIEVVKEQDIRPISRGFLNVPLQAYHCSLCGVAPIGTKWTQEAVDYFKSIMGSNLVKSVRFIEEHENGRAFVKLEVEKPDASKCDDVAALLISQGHAKEM